ncbi:hypothetical protein QOZ80_8BG0652690 [Eleusine coracana subsp. coracana]|nr:hypothetical protein QOZ80_8BG0652690 [Eleusine coracana subsp. coracana]
MAAGGSSKFNMVTRGSPKLSMAMANATKKKNFPEEKTRAYWNQALEKSLVVLLHEHNNTAFRDDKNKWSTVAWNKIAKEFNDRNRYASFTKGQIQDKETELKRDYKILKEARRHSECTWNEDRCMIEAEPTFWENLIITFPKAKKFRNNKASFPLYDQLRVLYDSHPTKRVYNCTSNEPPQDPPLRQVDNTDEIDMEEAMAYDVEDEDKQVQIIEDEYASSERIEQMLQTRADCLTRDEAASTESNGQQRRAAIESRNKQEKEAKRVKNSGSIEGLMKRHLDMRRKQVEDEVAQVSKIKEAAQGSDFSIKRCVFVLNLMELTKEEKAKAYAMFKNQDNREIFLSACSEDPESAIIWLRNEMA